MKLPPVHAAICWNDVLCAFQSRKSPAEIPLLCPLTFDQKFSALFSGKVTSSTLGIISIMGLVLGFIIAVSSFLGRRS